MTAPVQSIRRLRVAHFSLQSQDTDRQHQHDARALFQHALHRHYAWITGTEAGGGSDMAHHLKVEAKAAGFKLGRPKGQDCWVAVSKDLIDDNWSTYFDKVIEADGKAPNKHTAKGVCAVSFDNEGLGPITVIAEHALTQKNPGATQKNREMARATNAYAHKKGAGKGLVFLGSDTNLNDQLHDVHFGGDLTTIGDELKKWVTTGHGKIDVISSFDLDGRVEAVSVRDIPDSVLFLYSDHEGVEAEFDVKLLRGPR